MRPEDIFNQLQQHNENLALKVRLDQMTGQLSALRAELAEMQENCHAINDAAGVLRRECETLKDENAKLVDAGQRLCDIVEWLGSVGKLPPGTVLEASEAVSQWNDAI